VFAPTNEAFSLLPAGVLPNLLKPENKAQLVDLLTYHVVSGKYQAADLKDGQMLKTVEGKSVTVRLLGSQVLINSAEVKKADVEATNGVIHIIDGVLLPSGVPPAPPPSPPAPPALPSIAAAAVATPDLSTLVTALKAGDLVDTLSGPGNFTVFAPTNEAFAKLPAGVLASLLKPENQKQLVDLLTFHVVGSVEKFKDFNTIPGGCTRDHKEGQGLRLRTLEGEFITVSCHTNGGDRRYFFYLDGVGAGKNGLRFSVTYVQCSNGIVYVVDAVLIKTPYDKTIVELAVGNKDLATLVVALKAGDLVDTLNGTGPFTVFAPTNEAFLALPAGTLTNLLLPQNKAQLVDILTYHVVSGKIEAEDLTDGQVIKTVEGKSVTVKICQGTDPSGDPCYSQGKGRVLINGARFRQADVEASNGVVHVIESVLLPKSSNATRIDQY